MEIDRNYMTALPFRSDSIRKRSERIYSSPRPGDSSCACLRTTDGRNRVRKEKKLVLKPLTSVRHGARSSKSRRRPKSVVSKAISLWG